jgi:hypothetical protein
MTDENNANDSENNSYRGDADAQPKTVPDDIKGQLKQASAENKNNPADNFRKASFPVRALLVLWRRRKWRRIRKLDHPGPNWAEITTVILTGGIVLASFIQAGIYWEQAQIMQASLSQNERSIILGQGQLLVAARNAKTAEDTLGEMKSGGGDTHTLALATKETANTAKESLTRVQRAFVVFFGEELG